MTSNFWESFEKEAKKHKSNGLLERIRLGLPLHARGHSSRGIRGTRLGRALRRAIK